MSTSVNIADRWHLSRPRPGDQPCKCGRGRNKLYPSADHLKGSRWRVEWTDPRTKRLCHANRPKREGDDPDVSAEAYAETVRERLRGPYADPALRKGTFAAYAEQWRATRVRQDPETRALAEARLRLHVCEDPDNPGRTRRGGPALGHLTWEQLEQFPSLTQAWIAGLEMAQSTAALVVNMVSGIFGAAIDDGLISRNPVRARSTDRPKPVRHRAVPWTEAEAAAMEAALPERYAIVQLIGPLTGPRLGQMLALSVEDIDFLKREKFLRYRAQLRRAEGKLVFAPLKNKAEPDVPVADELVEAIAAHLERFPAAQVTLPWHHPADRERHGKPVTRRLVIASPAGRPLDHWTRDVWKPSLAKAGLIAAREQGKGWERNRDRGTHAAWRHTAASRWLADGVDIAAVAAWLGDTMEMVVSTYLHMMPSAPERGRESQRKYLSPRPSSRELPAEGDAGTLCLAGAVPIHISPTNHAIL